MDMKITKVNSLDLNMVYNVLTSSKITNAEKTKFLKLNKNRIVDLTAQKISSNEFGLMMEKRPLIKFRPLKNSFTKAGDKKLLAKTLNIKPLLVDSYIEDSIKYINGVENNKHFSKDELDTIKSYVYRHGTKQQVIDYLDYELSSAKDVLTCLYKTLEYHCGGVADYFIRPIHRMDNNTMFAMYNVVDKHLKGCEAAGQIDAVHNRQVSEWALSKIYQIQNNSKLIHAVKVYNELKS